MPFPINGHTPSLNWLVRMGQTDLLAVALVKWAQHHQMYPQGFWGYWQKRYPPVLKDGEYEIHGYAADFLNVGAFNRAKVMGKEEYVEVPKASFAHVGLEAGGIYQSAFNDMLLAGYSDTLRVFPATPKDWDCCFILHAVGGFVVTSEQRQGEVCYVVIKSRFGNKCSIANPWPNTTLRVIEISTGRTVTQTSDELITFETRPGSDYMLERIASPVSSYEVIGLTAQPNNDFKRLGDATLGKARQF